MADDDVQKDDETQVTPPPSKPILLYTMTTLASLAFLVSGYTLWQQKTQTAALIVLQDQNQQITSWFKESITVADTQKQQRLELSELKAQQQVLQSQLKNQISPPKLNTHQLLLNLNLQKALFALELAQLNALQNNDSTTTEALLKEADRQLKSIKNSRVLAIRQNLAKDIQMVSTQPEVDVAGTLMKIDALASEANALPLYHPAEQFKTPPLNAPNQTNKLKAHLEHALSMLKKLVILQYHENNPDVPVLSQEQGELKRSALLLELYMAELAAMTQDEVRFKQCLDKAITIAQHLFNPNAPKTKALISGLKQLQNVALKNPLSLSDKPIMMLQELLHTEGNIDD